MLKIKSMLKNHNKFLLTQSLLSSWQWLLINGKMDDFIKTLNREGIQKNKAMLDGIKFEGMIQACCEGNYPESNHEWYKPVTEIADIVRGGAYQVKLSKDIEVNGVSFVLYGIFDFLKEGVIYDTKFSKTYSVGKYLTSPQHPMYFELCPEAYAFEYLISDGKWVYKEKYVPEQCEPIDRIITPFMDFLDKFNLVEIYCDKWRSKY